MARQQRQAENDLRQLTELSGNTIDRTDQLMQRIEEAYRTLAEGTRYVYDRVHANEEIAEAWVCTELANAANTYQTLAHNVWQAILERTDKDNQQQICQATQLTRVNDALAFLAEANTARSQHLATFQGNVELWAADHQSKMSRVEEELRRAREEIRWIATGIPLPGSPRPRAPSPEPLQLWRSPAKIPSTSAASAAAPPPLPRRPILQSPIRLAPTPATRRQRRPAIPPSSPPLPLLPLLPIVGTTGGGGMGPPQGPQRLINSHSPSPLLSGDDDNLYVQDLPAGRPPPGTREPTRVQVATMLTPEEIARLVGAGIATARVPERAEQPVNRVNTSRLKMENPEKYDGKSSSTFNQWWESVTMYLGFYPEMIDRQKIAWVGTLLTDTALVWHLHRYHELRENDTWANYSAAIRAEYRNEREAADAQLKLGQLKYQGSTRAYLIVFHALNNFAPATGEALREKVDLAMPDAILDVRFAHYREDFADDEGFLQATHQAGLQVEKKKTLKAAREATRGPTTGTKDPRKENGKEKGNPAWAQPPTEQGKNPTGKGKKAWVSLESAWQRVPQKEREEYRATDNCWRCGRHGHKTFECYTFTTSRGTSLPVAHWKAAAVTGKRKATEELDKRTAKQQKVVAVEPMEMEGAAAPRKIEATPWDDSDSDF